LATHVHKGLKVGCGLLATIDHIGHVRSQDKRDAIPVNGPKLLRVVQKAAKVNVEEVAIGGDKQVVVVPVANAQNVGGHTIASALHHRGTAEPRHRGIAASRHRGGAQRLLTEAVKLACALAQATGPGL
jgi:hypothetical protein